MFVAAGHSLACNTLLGLPDVPVPIDTATDSAMPMAENDSGAQATDALPDNEDATVADASLSDATIDQPDTNTSNANDAGDAGPSCGDTTSDTHNCGACGHDCLGGTCSMSVCRPVSLVTAAQGANPSRLAQDDTFLYWTAQVNDRVYRTAKNGGGTVVLTQSTSEPIPVGVDDGGIYWGDIEGIWLCPKAGCAAGPSFIAPTVEGLPRGLAVDQGNVYWTEEGAINVLFAPKDALDASAGVLWQSDTTMVMWGDRDASDFFTERVAADGQRVYFTASDGRLRAVAVDGGDLQVIGALNESGGDDVTLDRNDVYWSVPDPAAGFIDRVALGTLADAGAVASGLSSPTSIATDGTSLYWAAASSGGSSEDIYACVIASCQPTRLAGDYVAPSIVVDSQAVYWTDYGATANSGAVWKLAK